MSKKSIIILSVVLLIICISGALIYMFGESTWAKITGTSNNIDNNTIGNQEDETTIIIVSSENTVDDPVDTPDIPPDDIDVPVEPEPEPPTEPEPPVEPPKNTTTNNTNKNNTNTNKNNTNSNTNNTNSNNTTKPPADNTVTNPPPVVTAKATIRGNISISNGSVSKASVRIVNLDNSTYTNVSLPASGSFTKTDLTPGNYNVEVYYNGSYRVAQTGQISLIGGQTTTFDQPITLPPSLVDNVIIPKNSYTVTIVDAQNDGTAISASLNGGPMRSVVSGGSLSWNDLDDGDYKLSIYLNGILYKTDSFNLSGGVTRRASHTVNIPIY